MRETDRDNSILAAALLLLSIVVIVMALAGIQAVWQQIVFFGGLALSICFISVRRYRASLSKVAKEGQGEGKARLRAAWEASREGSSGSAHK